MFENIEKNNLNVKTKPKEIKIESFLHIKCKIFCTFYIIELFVFINKIF